MKYVSDWAKHLSSPTSHLRMESAVQYDEMKKPKTVAKSAHTVEWSIIAPRRSETEEMISM